jgi:transcriptional regulator with XRE-family HTH domain
MEVIIGDRLRAVRKERKLSQSDIEKRTGLLRSYISRVENGHTVPVLETLEKITRALGVPLYQFFYNGDERSEADSTPKERATDSNGWGSSGKDARLLLQLRHCLSRMDERDRVLLLRVAQSIVRLPRGRPTSRADRTGKIPAEIPRLGA